MTVEWFTHFMGLEAVDRMAMVMSALADTSNGPESSLNDVCDRTGLARSTASRFLNALADHGYVFRSSVGTFCLGPTPNAHGHVEVGYHRMSELGHPHLRSLADDVQEAVCISVLDGIETRTIYQVGVPQPVIVENWVDRRWPILPSGSAISILSTWSPTAINATLTLLPTSKRKSVAKAIDAARSNPLSWSADSYVDALTSVAAPIVDGRGHAIAAVIIYGPTFRFPTKYGKSKIEKQLRLAAKAIGEDVY